MRISKEEFEEQVQNHRPGLSRFQPFLVSQCGTMDGILFPHFHMDGDGFGVLFDNRKSLRVPIMLFTEECVGNARQMGGRHKSDESRSEVWTLCNMFTKAAGIVIDEPFNRNSFFFF